jgi:hypothetical protein
MRNIIHEAGLPSCVDISGPPGSSWYPDFRECAMDRISTIIIQPKSCSDLVKEEHENSDIYEVGSNKRKMQ